jgi:hypothetical protein
MEWSRWCLWYWNCEHADSNSLHQSVIIAWCNRTSRDEYILPTRPLRLTEVYNPSKLPPHSSPGSSLSSTFFLAFFCASNKKSCNLYGTNELFVSKWIIKLNKGLNFFILISILPSCSVIISKPPYNSIVSSITFNCFLAIKICTRKFSLIS